MTKKSKNEQTSARLASLAGKILSNPKSSRNAKALAGTLTQAQDTKRGSK